MRRVAVLAAVLVVAGCSSTSGSGSSSTAASTARSTRVTAAPAVPSSGSATSTRSAGTTSSTPHRLAPKLTGFRVADLTWIGDEGWALGEANCLSGSGRCDAIEHTDDGGRTWVSLPAPAGAHVAVPDGYGHVAQATCTRICLTGLRFATSKIGYAFGANALYDTADGGLTWHRRPGGALFLEAADGTVIRVVSSGGGCPGPCHVGVETAPTGSSQWSARSLPGTMPATYGLAFGRTGARAYLLFEGHTAGGAQHATSTLFRSGDDGRSWALRGEPCPQSGGREQDSSLPASGPDGSLALLCEPRGSGHGFVITSTDGGKTFAAKSRTALGAAFARTLAAASARVILVSTDDTYRSTDGGDHFTRLSANAGSSPGLLAYLGFASSSVGHGISADYRSVWTTRDGGRTWTSYRFP